MSLRATLVVTIIGSLLAAGCGPSDTERKAEREKNKQRRAAKIAKQLSEPVKATHHAVGPHEIISVAVPYDGGYGSFVEVQRCFIWRDAEFKTSSIACPSPAELDLSAPDP